jgi:hypothetical protein
MQNNPVSYQGIASATPQMCEIGRPFRGQGRAVLISRTWQKGQLRGGARAESCPEMSLERRIVVCDVRAGSIRRLKKGSRPKAGRAHSKVATRQQQSWFRQQFATA